MFFYRNSKKTAGVLLAVLCALSLSGCRIGNTEFVLKEKKVSEKVIFQLNGEKCELPEAKVYLANYKNLYGTAYDVKLWGGDYNENNLEQYIKDITLEELEHIYAIQGLAKKQDVALTEDEKENVKSMASEYYDSLTEDEKDFMDVSEKDLVAIYERYVLAQKLYKQLTASVHEEVSEDEARVIQAQIIYTTNEENANYVAESLAGRGKFENLAARYNELDSIDIYMARGDFPEEVEKAAFNLDNEENSEMIEVDGAYYFIRCLNKLDQEKTEENIEVIRLKKQKAQFDDLYDSFIEDSEFHLYEDHWDVVSLLDSEYELSTDSFFKIYEKYMGE